MIYFLHSIQTLFVSHNVASCYCSSLVDVAALKKLLFIFGLYFFDFLFILLVFISSFNIFIQMVAPTVAVYALYSDWFTE